MANESEYFKVYLKDGVICYELKNKLNADIIFAAEQAAYKLIQDNGIRITPAIIWFKDIDDEHLSIGISDLGKIVSMNDIMKYASGIWFVGAKGKAKHYAAILNSVFLGGKIKFVDDIETARREALARRSEDKPILEQ